MFIARPVKMIFFSCAIAITSSLAEGASQADLCDNAAASPYDPERPPTVPGVESDKLDAKIALDACRAAVDAAPNNPRLVYQLGRAFRTSKDFENARNAFMRAATRGYAAAQFAIGAMYSQGESFEKDDAKALIWFKKAADQGMAVSQYTLGLAYERGEGTEKDYAKAMVWHRKKTSP